MPPSVSQWLWPPPVSACMLRAKWFPSAKSSALEKSTDKRRKQQHSQQLGRGGAGDAWPEKRSIWMARHNDHMSTAVTFVCYTIHVFAYLLATSKQRDRVGGTGREVGGRERQGERMRIIVENC